MFDTFATAVGNNVGWFSINVLVPALLPFLLIVAVAAAYDGVGLCWRMMKKAVEEGQLCWVVLGMLASSGYEAFLAYDEQHRDLHVSIAWTVGLCIVGAIFTSIFIALSTLRSANGVSARPVVVWYSLLATLAMCFYYPIAHVKFA